MHPPEVRKRDVKIAVEYFFIHCFFFFLHIVPATLSRKGLNGIQNEQHVQLLVNVLIGRQALMTAYNVYISVNVKY